MPTDTAADLDPLVRPDGSRVTAAADWPARRREILAQYEQLMYGCMPEADGGMQVQTVESAAVEINGVAAARKQLRLTFGNAGPAIEVLLYLPKSDRPVGVFVGLNFGGNPSVSNDPAVHFSACLERAKSLGIAPAIAAAERGSAAGRWPVGDVLRGGFGIATAWSADIEPDQPDARSAGVRALFDASYTWATIAAWAWGLRRMADALLLDPAIDPRALAVIGHSRLGKAALWAGATDERFSLVISNNSGCCGAALKRRKQGESYFEITRRFPHWFVDALKQWNDREDLCPIDAHLLLAAIAPRPLYVASATDDAWADPLGEFLGAYHAGPAYRLLGRVPLASIDPPSPDTPVGVDIGYHLRTGPHDIVAADWRHYIAFARRHWSHLA